LLLPVRNPQSGSPPLAGRSTMPFALKLPGNH
jgi:hypothetical protein